LPLILLATLTDFLLHFFRPRDDGLNWLGALFVLALLVIVSFIAVITVANFVFNL
jgi:hypothetical protein